MYEVDVTLFRQPESKEGFPKAQDDETGAYALFHRTIGELYSTPEIAGSYTVILYAVGKDGGEHPLLVQLVNVPRTSGESGVSIISRRHCSLGSHHTLQVGPR